MKNILVLTDFSRNAAHAAESATWLAENLHTSLLLWNCSPKVPVIPGYLGGPLVAKTLAGPEESKELLDRTVLDLEDFINNTDGSYKPRLLSRYAEGSLQQALAAQLREEATEMIVIGSASAECFIDHIFTGSDTYKIIETATCPVLIVPPRAGLDQLDKVVFATNFELQDLQAIHYLISLSGVFGFHIEFVHVIVTGDKDETIVEKESAFHTQLATIKKTSFSFKEIKAKEVSGCLNRISKQTGADVLAMTHHQYSFFKRLLNDSMAKKELSDQKIPLLIFPIK